MLDILNSTVNDFIREICSETYNLDQNARYRTR